MQVTHVETPSEETPRLQLSEYTGTRASYALHIYTKRGHLWPVPGHLMPDTWPAHCTLGMVEKTTKNRLLTAAIATSLASLSLVWQTTSVAASRQDAKRELLEHVSKITADRVRLSDVSIDLQNALAIKKEVQQRLDPLVTDIKKEREESAQMAVDLYVVGDDHVVSGVLASSKDPLSIVSNLVMLEPVGLSRNQLSEGLTSTSDALSAKLDELNTLIPMLSKERQYLVASESKNSKKLDVLARATVRQHGDIPLLGNPQVKATTLAAYAELVSPKWVMPVSRLQLATWYIEEGRAESVRGDVAFLQAARETGWFKFEGSKVSISQNNFAGIGACDSCKSGESFPSVQEGVRAQIQMIRTYADPNYSSKTTARPAIGRIDTNPVRGCCSTWYELGEYWASATDYAKRVVRMFNAVTYTARQEGW